MTSTRAAPQVEVKSAQSCPLCHEPLTALPRLLACPECQVIHHEACVAELGRCGTMSCPGLRDVAASGEGPALPQSDNARTLGAGAYVGNLVGAAFVLPALILLFARRRGDAFAAHHAKQSLLLCLLAMVTLGLATPLFLLGSLAGAFKAYHGEWWVLPGCRGERWVPRPLRGWLHQARAQEAWELQRKAGQTRPFPVGRRRSKA